MEKKIAMAVDGVEITGDTILKPSSPHPLFNTLVHLNIFDKLHRAGHVPVIYAFRPPMPDNDTIKDALSRTLCHFPHLAGRLIHDESGRPCFLLNDAGVRVVETFIPTPLEEHLPLDPSTNFSNLYLPSQGVEELLLVQLNRFSCGGLLMGIVTHHFISDGVSSSLYQNAWAKLTRGGDVDPLPYHDRAAVAVPRNPPHCVVNHREREFFDPPLPSDEIRANPPPVSYIRVHLSKELIAKLKEKVTAGDPSRRSSTFFCVLAHVWKKVTQARGLGDKTTTQIRVGVNGRPRLQPPVPTEYFGNLVLFAAPTLTAGELLKGSYPDIAGVIQEAVAKVDNDYFRSFIDFDEKLKEEGVFEIERRMPVIGDSVCPDMEVATWLGLRLNDLDFGGGKPCAFVRPDVDFEGMLFLMPSCEEEGGVDVCVSLMKDHATYFKQNATSVDSV